MFFNSWTLNVIKYEIKFVDTELKTVILHEDLLTTPINSSFQKIFRGKIMIDIKVIV
jgi:hypothetical protein